MSRVLSKLWPGRAATSPDLRFRLSSALAPKWLKLMKQIAPNVTRVGVVCDTADNITPAVAEVLDGITPPATVTEIIDTAFATVITNDSNEHVGGL